MPRHRSKPPYTVSFHERVRGYGSSYPTVIPKPVMEDELDDWGPVTWLVTINPRTGEIKWVKKIDAEQNQKKLSEN